MYTGNATRGRYWKSKQLLCMLTVLHTEILKVEKTIKVKDKYFFQKANSLNMYKIKYFKSCDDHMRSRNMVVWIPLRIRHLWFYSVSVP